MGSLDMVEFYVYTYIQTHVPDWLGSGGRMGEGESRCILRKKVLKVYHDHSFNSHYQVRTDQLHLMLFYLQLYQKRRGLHSDLHQGQQVAVTGW